MADDGRPERADDTAPEGEDSERDWEQKQNQAIRDIVRGAGIVYGGLFIEILIAFLAQVLAARYLSVSDFGGVTTGVALLNIGAIVGSLGLGRGMTRYFPRTDREDRGKIARGAYLLSVPVALVVGGLVTFNAGFVASSIFRDPTVEPSIRVFGAVIPFAAALRVTIGAIRGQKVSRYRVYVENIFRPVVRFSLVVTAVLWGAGQFGFAGAYAIPYVLGSVLAIVLFLRTLPEVGEDWTIDLKQTQAVLRYSLPFIISGATGFVYRSADIFLVLYILDSGAVGTYGVAYAAARLLMLFSTAFNFLGAPVSSELESGGGITDAVKVNRSVLRWLTVLSIPALVPLVFFPAEFISVLYRPRYAEGGMVLAILAVGFAIHNVLGAQGSILEALGRSRLIAVNSAVGAATNVAANLVLIPRIGIEGAAIATVISYVLMDLLLVSEVRYLTDANLLTRKVVAPVVVALPWLGVTRYLSPLIPGTLPWLVFLGVAFATVYLLSVVVVLGVESEEVMLVKSVEERYGVDLGPITWLAQRFSK
jgi:O-antigen/teichoic acid export membrane protein